jgi:hypothetical protein
MRPEARGLRGVLKSAWGGEHPAGDGGIQRSGLAFAAHRLYRSRMQQASAQVHGTVSASGAQSGRLKGKRTLSKI